MDFTAFDTRKIDEYARRAKETWGATPEYHEFEEKSKGRSKEEEKDIGIRFMQIFARLGEIKDGSPKSPEAQALVKEIQQFITDHYYTCSDQILASLGKAYGGGGSMNENIDKAGGEGTGVFAAKAIEFYVKEGS